MLVTVVLFGTRKTANANFLTIGTKFLNIGWS